MAPVGHRKKRGQAKEIRGSNQGEWERVVKCLYVRLRTRKQSNARRKGWYRQALLSRLLWSPTDGPKATRNSSELPTQPEKQVWRIKLPLTVIKSIMFLERLYITMWCRYKTSFIQKRINGWMIQAVVSSIQYNIKTFKLLCNFKWCYECLHLPDTRILELGNYEWLFFFQFYWDNWHTALYRFKAYNIMTWLPYLMK